MHRTAPALAALALLSAHANAQLTLTYDATAQTLALTGTDSGDFNPLVSWQTGSFGEIPTVIDMIAGVHYELTPASTIDADLNISVTSASIQLETFGLASVTGYTFEGLGTAVDASAFGAGEVGYLLANDGLAITLFNGSGFAPVTLSVVPAPGALAVFGGVFCFRRRRSISSHP